MPRALALTHSLRLRGRRQVTVWNFKGEPVTHFEDHTLWHPDTNTNNIYITAAQDYIISYCRPKNGDESGGRGAVHISHILSGRCVAKLPTGAPEGSEEAPPPDGEVRHHQEHCGGVTDVTALHFSEERNEVYVGSRQGVLHVWAQ